MRHGTSHADLIVTLALLPLVALVCLAGVAATDNVHMRILCAGNLRQIGMATLMYSNDMKGAYPRTRYEPDASPVWGTPYESNPNLGSNDKADPFAADDSPLANLRPKPNDVTAALYLLMRTQDITSAEFICPATLQERWDFGGGANTALNWTNWPGNARLAEHLSYSYQNPYPSKAAVADGFKWSNSFGESFALASDFNPGTEDLVKLTPDSGEKQMKRGNSPNHNRAGQNVMYGDGHVEFHATPFAGVNRDNIFTFGPSGSKNREKGGDGIVGSPTSSEDSILLPTAHDIGAADEHGDSIAGKKFQTFSESERQKIRESMVGAYSRKGGGTLRITRESFTVDAEQPATYEPIGIIDDRTRFHVRRSDRKHPDVVYMVIRDNEISFNGSIAWGTWMRE